MAFVLIYVLAQAGHFFLKDKADVYIVNLAHILPAVKIINTLTPNEKAFQRNKEIQSSFLRMKVAQGCDGMDGILLLGSAIVAFPMPVIAKSSGMILGMLTVYLANLSRIILLYYGLRFTPDWFDYLHTYVGQIMIILIGGLFFIFWVTHHDKFLKYVFQRN